MWPPPTRPDRRVGLARPTAFIFLLSTLLATGIEVAPAESIPARPAVLRDNVWHLRNSLSSGFADSSFAYGRASDFPLMGDWDGDGTKTPGVVRGNLWYLRNSNAPGVADIVFAFGRATDFPIVGDWNGDGIDSPGVTRTTFGIATASETSASVCGPGFTTWYLRNSNSPGVADETFVYHCPSDVIVGDWDGDRDDTPGARPIGSNFWALNNDLDGVADVTFSYGRASDFPIAGDWDGDEQESVGVVRGNTWFLKNENTSGPGDVSFSYGTATDIPLVWGVAP